MDPSVQLYRVSVRLRTRDLQARLPGLPSGFRRDADFPFLISGFVRVGDNPPDEPRTTHSSFPMTSLSRLNNPANTNFRFDLPWAGGLAAGKCSHAAAERVVLLLGAVVR